MKKNFGGYGVSKIFENAFDFILMVISGFVYKLRYFVYRKGDVRTGEREILKIFNRCFVLSRIFEWCFRV